MINLSVLSDISIIIFNLSVYLYIIPLKKNTYANKTFLILGCIAMVVAYCICTLVFDFAAGLSSMLCMSIPSFLLFLFFAKYKDMRFIVTFCLIDTITLIIAFLSRYLEYLCGLSNTVLPFCVTIVVLVVILSAGRKFLKIYKYLIDNVENCWGDLAVSSFFIYIILILTASYPTALVNRLEYSHSYFFLCITILTFYFVFIKSVLKTKKIEDKNRQLKEQIELATLAYTDSLTGLGNRTLFDQTISHIKDGFYKYESICVIVIDLNRLKVVNDTYGHFGGDACLKYVAETFKKTFSSDHSMIFRFGGDEFCIICFDNNLHYIEHLLDKMQTNFEENKPYPEIGIAYGYEILTGDSFDTIETVFKKADENMYINKKKSHENEPIQQA